MRHARRAEATGHAQAASLPTRAKRLQQRQPPSALPQVRMELCNAREPVGHARGGVRAALRRKVTSRTCCVSAVAILGRIFLERSGGVDFGGTARPKACIASHTNGQARDCARGSRTERWLRHARAAVESARGAHPGSGADRPSLRWRCVGDSHVLRCTWAVSPPNTRVVADGR
eukprot:3054282-Prymnesium_polylepis.1